MAKTDYVELPEGLLVKILYEDRSVLAIDKPAGWMLGPEDEEHIRRNLHVAMTLGIEAGLWWARCRGLRFVRFIHRLDAPTTGVLLMAKSPGALAPYSKLFATRQVGKTYLAVTDGIPREQEWTCSLPLGPDPGTAGRHKVDEALGKPAETRFKVLEVRQGQALVECYPTSGRTHQIRLHLKAAGCPVAGDILYGHHHPSGLGLRAVELTYPDPFSHRPIRIFADRVEFQAAFGFAHRPGAAKPVMPPIPAAPIVPPSVPAAPNPKPLLPAARPSPGPSPAPVAAGKAHTRPVPPARPSAPPRPADRVQPTRPQPARPAPTPRPGSVQKPAAKPDPRGPVDRSGLRIKKPRRRG